MSAGAIVVLHSLGYLHEKQCCVGFSLHAWASLHQSIKYFSLMCKSARKSKKRFRCFPKFNLPTETLLRISTLKAGMSLYRWSETVLSPQSLQNIEPDLNLRHSSDKV
jgi:hypothetical protein